MTTSIAAGSGNLPFGVVGYKGQGCKQASLVSSVALNGCPQRELSWYLITILVSVLNWCMDFILMS